MNSPASQSAQSAASDSLVRFVDVQKSYDGVTLVVKKFNLDMYRGEFLTMLGPSGSGKTTCLMMLAGFEPATHGEIYLNNQPINNVPPCFIPQIVYSTTFGYRIDKVGDTPPSSINDVFDLDKFPGKRSLEKKPVNNLEWALLADGVAADDVYDMLESEEGVARAFAKLDTIKDSVIWWEKGAQTPQLLADGEIVMGSTYNGRLFSVIEEEKQPVAMMWDWQVYDLDGWVIPAGSKNVDDVKKYLTFATDTQRLADQAKYISYGPARASSAPMVGKHADLGIDMGPHMPTAPSNASNTLLYNYEFWADNVDDLTEQFQAWLAK